MSASSPFTSNSISKFPSSPLVLRNGVFRAQFWGKSSRFRASSNGLDRKAVEEGLGDSAETKVEDEEESKGANSISNGAASTTINPALDKELKKLVMEIPLGLRFQPFDYDVLRFLFDFVTGRTSLDDEALIHQEDVFGENEPWELIPPGKKMAYFLTRLKKKAKSMKGSRVQRTVGRKIMGKKSGNWHGQDTGKAVVDQDGKFLMGYKRSFVYKNKSEPEQDGQWLLKEFYLPVTIIRRARAEFRIVEEREDFVLTLEQGGTSSNDFEAVPVPIPIETTTLQIAEGSNDDDDAINSYVVGVPMETAIVEGVPVETLLAPTDNNNSYIVAIPSLRARDCSKNEKEALNYLFLLIPLLNIIVPFFWKSFAVVWSVDIVAFFGMYAWKVGWLQKQ
nr:NAC domain-containing protein 83-like [Ipomoea batatas]